MQSGKFSLKSYFLDGFGKIYERYVRSIISLQVTVASRLVTKKVIFYRPDLMPLDDCKLLFVNEIFDIEKPGTQVNEFDEAFDASASPVKRMFMYMFSNGNSMFRNLDFYTNIFINHMNENLQNECI